MLWLDLTPGDDDDGDDCPTLVTQGRFEGVKLFRRQGGEWTEVASFHVPHTGFCRGYLERTEEGGGGDTVAVVPSGQSTVMVARLVASFIRPVVSLQREAAGSLMCLAPGPASARGRLLAGYEVVPQKVASELHPKVRNHGEAPTRAFSWLKAATTAFTFKTLLRRYAKRALTPRSLNVKLGPRRNYDKGRAAIRHYANPYDNCVADPISR